MTADAGQDQQTNGQEVESDRSENDRVGKSQQNIWRLPPSLSFSDFTVVIENVQTEERSIYHVHKTHMVFGAYRSEYFTGLLHGGGQLFAEQNCVEIKLADAAARAFPAFLDSLYAGELMNAKAERAVALIHLGNYFGVLPLVEEVRRRILCSLRLDNLNEYLPDIIDFQKDIGMDKIYMHAKHLVVQAVFDKSSWVPALVNCMDIEFLVQVMQLCNALLKGRKVLVLKKSEDCYWSLTSIIVARFLAARRENLTVEDLGKATDERWLPKVSSKVALQILDIEIGLQRASCGGEDDRSISSLQLRCAKSLLSKRTKHGPGAEEIFNKLSKKQLVDILSWWVLPRYSSSDDKAQTTAPHHVKVLSVTPGLCGLYKYILCENAEHPQGYYWMAGKWKGNAVIFLIVQRAGQWAFGYRAEEPDFCSLYYSRSTKDAKYPPAWGWRDEHSDSPPLFLQFCDGDKPGTKVDL